MHGTAKRTALTVAGIGGMLVVASTLPFMIGSPFIIGFLLWALLPYAALACADRLTSNAWVIGGAGAAAIAVEAGIRAAVFVFPRGSTAAIALVFSPALVAVVAIPLGAAAGAAFGWVFGRSSILLRVPLIVVAAAILSLTFIGFARPELFPTAVAKRRAALESIGDARVVAGGDAFTATPISDKIAWHQAGELDGDPGDEIAVVDHNGAELFDGVGLSARTLIPFGGPKGRFWNGYSRLHLLNGKLMVVQTGGGYQETEVRTLDNELLWRYRPDANLAPTALMPGDLDGDLVTEFYASATTHVARLDGSGRSVWTRPATLPAIVAIAPRTPSAPSWIVATRYEQHIQIWTDAGDVVAALPWPDGVRARVAGVVEWPNARGLVMTGEAPELMRIDASRIPLSAPDYMTLQEAKSIRWTAASEPLLATLWSADREVNRWRLRLLDASATVVYDEVFDRAIALHVATTADGRSRLLLSGGGLSSLAPMD